MRFDKPWDFSEGADVVPMHLCEVVFMTDTSFPYRARSVALYLAAIRMGRD